MEMEEGRMPIRSVQRLKWIPKKHVWSFNKKKEVNLKLALLPILNMVESYHCKSCEVVVIPTKKSINILSEIKELVDINPKKKKKVSKVSQKNNIYSLKK